MSLPLPMTLNFERPKEIMNFTLTSHAEDMSDYNAEHFLEVYEDVDIRLVGRVCLDSKDPSSIELLLECQPE
jgi:hypothetical protein